MTQFASYLVIKSVFFLFQKSCVAVPSISLSIQMNFFSTSSFVNAIPYFLKEVMLNKSANQVRMVRSVINWWADLKCKWVSKLLLKYNKSKLDKEILLVGIECNFFIPSEKNSHSLSRSNSLFDSCNWSASWFCFW